MAKFVITPGDALRGKPIKPGWYPGEIIKVEEKAAKTDQSQNVNVSWRILAGPFKNYEVTRTFNEKAPGFLIDFLESFGAKLNKEQNTEVELGDNLVGKKQQIYIVNGEYNGKTTNNVESFRPFVAPPEAAKA